MSLFHRTEFALEALLRSTGSTADKVALFAHPSALRPFAQSLTKAALKNIDFVAGPIEQSRIANYRWRGVDIFERSLEPKGRLRFTLNGADAMEVDLDGTARAIHADPILANVIRTALERAA